MSSCIPDMKNIIHFAVLAMVVGFSACSKDDSPNDEAVNGGTCRVISAQGVVYGLNASMTLSYTAQKQLASYISSTGTDSEGALYHYNANGELIKEESFEGDNANDINAKTEYTWSGSKLTKLEFFFKNNGTLELQHTGIPTYTGNRITSIVESSNGIDESKRIYTYDALGNVKSVTYQLSDGVGGWENSERYTYEYDTKKVAKGFDVILSDEPVILSPNNRTREIVETYNSQTQSWSKESDLRYSYAYNASGYPIQISLGFLGNINLNYACD